MGLTTEQMEEYKQTDARIVFYLGQANRLTTAYFIGFVAFCAWVAKDANQDKVVPFAVLLAVGLFLGAVLLVIHARAIARLRAYKTVFHEHESDHLRYESTRTFRGRRRATGRTHYYGLFGLIVHVIGTSFVLSDPLGCFAPYGKGTMWLLIAMFLPGLGYTTFIAFGREDLQRYVERYERIKKAMSEQSS